MIQDFERMLMRTDVPDFKPGDTVRVQVRVREGDKERIQMFEGVVLGRSGGGIQETFTVRKISYGIGVERVFPVHSPMLAGIDVLSSAHVRRAKLNYLRDLKGKAARLKEKRARIVLPVEGTDQSMPIDETEQPVV